MPPFKDDQVLVRILSNSSSWRGLNWLCHKPLETVLMLCGRKDNRTRLPDYAGATGPARVTHACSPTRLNAHVPSSKERKMGAAQSAGAKDRQTFNNE